MRDLDVRGLPGLATKASMLTCCLLAASCGFDERKRNPVAAPGPPLVAASEIETVLELDEPPGNVTVSADGRVFFTFHPAADPEVHVAAATPGGGFAPFPGLEWQEEREGSPHFVSPLSLRADRAGRLWVLDHGDFGRETPSLTVFSIASRDVLFRFEFSSDIAGRGSMLNDFWVDAEREVVYIADTSVLAFNPALVVLDIATGTVRRLLEDHPSVEQEDHHMVVQGEFLRVLGLPLQVAVDSIALSTDGETLYFGPLTGSLLSRIETAALLDTALSPEALADRVEPHAAKPSTDGIAADSEGNLYLTAIEDDAIWIVRANGSLEVLARDRELLSWPDGVHLSPDERFLYVTASELHHVIGADLEAMSAQRPFRILRVPLPSAQERSASGI